jgi:hypothetical protein
MLWGQVHVKQPTDLAGTKTFHLNCLNSSEHSTQAFLSSYPPQTGYQSTLASLCATIGNLGGAYVAIAPVQSFGPDGEMAETVLLRMQVLVSGSPT